MTEEENTHPCPVCGCEERNERTGLLTCECPASRAPSKDESTMPRTDDIVIATQEVLVPYNLKCHKCGASEPWKDANRAPSEPKVEHYLIGELECYVCHERFKDQAGLNGHLYRRSHRLDAQPEATPSEPVCGDCGRLKSIHFAGDGCPTSGARSEPMVAPYNRGPFKEIRAVAATHKPHIHICHDCGAKWEEKS